MFTDSGEYVTWSVFDDIDYGELDFISSYATYTAARKAPDELPKRVSQFFEGIEEIVVSFEHDCSVCPMVRGEGVDHGMCWRITLPFNCPTTVRKVLDRLLTGEDVNGLLSPGRIFAGGKLYTFVITPPTVSELDESIVFHEDRYIRILFRTLGVRLRQLDPGTFLHVADQRWVISITWDENHLRWEAQSTLSGLKFKGGSHTVKLVHGTNAYEECERVIASITSLIPEEHISDYSDFEEKVLSGLRTLGYSKSSPPCHLHIIESSSSVFSYGVYLVGKSLREPLVRFTIEAESGYSPDTSIEMMEINLLEGELSHFNIRNIKSFMKRYTTWVNKNVLSIEDMFEE